MDRSDTTSSAAGRVTSVASFLQHYGVQGMKWGSRKASSGFKSDKQFEKSVKRDSTTQKVFESGIKSWNSSPAFKAIEAKHKNNLKKSGFRYGLTTNRKAYKSYNIDMGRAFAKHLNEHAGKAGKNPSGTRQYGVKLEYMSDTKWKVITRPIKHEDEVILVELVRDKDGFITEFKMAETTLEQSDSVNEFLAHYGVQGMKWGKKKNPASSDSSASTTVRTAAKKKGVHTVSNKDLQTAIERMRLEQDFKRLRVNDKPAVTRWISSTLLEVGKREVQARAVKAIAKKAVGA